MGIQATIYHPKYGSGKAIGLSVSQLKDITEKTGIRLESTITTERFAEILLGNTERNRWGDSVGWDIQHTSREWGIEYDR